MFKPVSKNQEDYDKFHKANKDAKEIAKAIKASKKPSERDYKKLSKALDDRADAASKIFGVKISSISYEDSKRFRDMQKEKYKKKG